MNISIEGLKSPDLSQTHILKTHQDARQTSIYLQASNSKTQRDTLLKCIARMRSFTQVKNYNSLTAEQLGILSDKASPYQELQQAKEVTDNESHFEKRFLQQKDQRSKMQHIILQVVNRLAMKNVLSFKPSHPLLIIWNLIKFCFMIHIFIVFPLMDAFGDQIQLFINGQHALFICEWVFLIFDLLIRFNVQVYINGELVKDNTPIAKAYLKSGFLVDLCGLIAFTLFLFDDRWFIRYIYFFKITEMRKFLKLLRRELDPQNKSKNYIELLKLLFTIFLLSHIIACVWVAMAKLPNEKNWIQFRNLESEHWFVQYVWAFYFAILTMTTVGYGDVVPVNYHETLACIAIVLLSSGIFAYTLNTITTVLKDFDSNKIIYDEDIRLIQNYMHRKGITSGLQRKVKQYLKHMWKKGLNDQLNQELRVFQQLSPSLQQEINLQDKGSLFLQISFFVNHFSIDFLKSLMQTVQQVYFQPGELLPSQDGLYILYKGSAELLCQLKNNRLKRLCLLYEKDHYGLLNLVETPDQNIKIRTRDFCIFYFIPTECFIDTLRRNMNDSTDYETYCMVRDQARAGNLESLYLKCHVCRKPGHPPCQDLLFKPSLQLSILKADKSIEQPRTSSFVRFHQKDLNRRHSDVQRSAIKISKRMEDLSYHSSLQSELEDHVQSFRAMSESGIINPSQLDEKQSSNQIFFKNQPLSQSQELSRQRITRRQIVMPTLISQHRQVIRKGTYENTINQFQQRTSPDSMSPGMQRDAKEPSRSQLNINQIQLSQEGIMFDEIRYKLQFDRMKSYKSYFKHGNFEEVISKFKPKRKIRRAQRIGS